MKRSIFTLPSLLLIAGVTLAALPSQAEDQNWDYYSSILEKGMFPQPPKPAPPPPPEVKIEPPPPNWKINYKVNMVHRQFSNGEIRVGVTNMKGSEGRPVNMMLSVGEKHDSEGIKIESVDLNEDEPAVVMISKDDGDPIPFELASSVAAPGASAPTRGRSPTPQRGSSRPSTTPTRSVPTIQRGGSSSTPQTTSGTTSTREAALRAWRERMSQRGSSSGGSSRGGRGR